MASTLATRLIHVTIERSVQEVYRFLADPENLPRWASGLAKGIRNINGVWHAETPQGPLEVRFAPQNDFGVLDHEIVLASGQVISIPLRVVANGTGSELIFTLFRQPDMRDEKFTEDTAWVARDLERLKTLLEV